MVDQPFVLHPQLQEDTYVVGRFPLSVLLLCNDANYPWCILVPRREGVREIHHLGVSDRQALLDESCTLAACMEQLFKPIKMNVAALGNMVPQLHIHHIARFEVDAAWPAPIWGKVAAKSYESQALTKRIEGLREVISEADNMFVYQ